MLTAAWIYQLPLWRHIESVYACCTSVESVAERKGVLYRGRASAGPCLRSQRKGCLPPPDGWWDERTDVLSTLKICYRIEGEKAFRIHSLRSSKPISLSEDGTCRRQRCQYHAGSGWRCCSIVISALFHPNDRKRSILHPEPTLSTAKIALGALS